MSDRHAWLPCKRLLPVPPPLLATPQLETAVCRLMGRMQHADRHGTEGDFAAADLDHQAALNELLRRYELGAVR